MQKSYECEVATHIGLESCGAARKGGVEALTGKRAGRVFSRVRISLRDAHAVGGSGRFHLVHRYREVSQSPARSETSCIVFFLLSSLEPFPYSPQCSCHAGPSPEGIADFDRLRSDGRGNQHSERVRPDFGLTCFVTFAAEINWSPRALSVADWHFCAN